MNQTHKIEFTPTQFDFVTDTAKYSCMCGGYKSGKTYTGAYKFAFALLEIKQPGLVCSATYDLFKKTSKPAIEQALKNLGIPYIYSPSDKSFKITTYDAKEKKNIQIEIMFRTLANAHTFEGLNIGVAWFDEIDLLTYDKALDAFNTVISKLTLSNNCKCMITGTNEGYQFIYKKFFLDSDKVDTNKYVKDGMSLYICPTMENSENLPEGFIGGLYAQYDERTAKRYLEGEFVNLNSDRAYYGFTEANYTNEVYDPKRDAYLCFDFNVNPMVCLLVQQLPEIEDYTQFACVKEFVQYDSSTSIICKSVADFLEETKFEGRLRATGDYSGGARKSSSDYSDWVIIERNFKNYNNFKVKKKPTRRVRERLNCANAFFRNYENEMRMFVNKDTCALTVDDLFTTSLKDNGEIDHSGGRSHCSDALSEFAKNYYPIRKELTYHHL